MKNNSHAVALRYLSLTVFILFAMPLLNVKIGPIPIYGIDFIIFMTWFYARRIGPSRRFPLQGLVVCILVAALLSEFIAGIQLGTLLQPVYLIIRTMLAISLFFSVPAIVQTKSDLMTLLKAGLLGTLITAALMVSSSLPQTQAMVARRVFSYSFLLPSAESVVARYGFAEIAMRGQSLVGISILSAAFLNTIWPLLFLLRTDEKLDARWKAVMFFAFFLVPLGVVMSYSRGAIAGLVMVVLIVVLLNSGRVRQPLVIGVGIAILIFSWAGWGSEYFKFEWLQEKTEYQFANPYRSNDMTQRIYAYSEPFQLVLKNPAFVIFGEGFARDKIAGTPPSAGFATHAVFAAATYGYGMLAAFAYMGLLLGALQITWSHAWGAKDEFLTIFSRALLAGLFGFSSWFILGHAAVSEPRGAALLFFIFGLVAAQSNFAGLPGPEQQKQRLVSHRKFGNKSVH